MYILEIFNRTIKCLEEFRKNRIISLIGDKGVGKTRVASKFTWQQLKHLQEVRFCENLITKGLKSYYL
jgi:flagellar biosynthesis GTPase FlhF